MQLLGSVALLSLVVACGGSALDDPMGSPGDPASPGDEGPTGKPPQTADDLATATGCAGVFNPSQVLEYQLVMTEGDWSRVQQDTTNSIYVPAELSCGEYGPITVAVRRKRSGGTTKVGLKVDINQFVAGQSYFGLKKLSLENGISEGGTDAEVGGIYSEYLAWRLMVRSGAVTGRAAMAQMRVNGAVVGVYVNVEQVDKRFLRDRLGDDSGWLFKFSGSSRDGQKTNLGIADPHAEYFCFFERNGCPTPPDAELAATLPGRLDIDQLLRIGAVNALMANTDSPLLKSNNFLYYDRDGGRRIYFPWDLDTAMKDDYDVLTGTVPGGTTAYTDALFSNWRDDYLQILQELVTDTLALPVILGELDDISALTAAALAADPHVTGDPDGATAKLKDWWTNRHGSVACCSLDQ